MSNEELAQSLPCEEEEDEVNLLNLCHGEKTKDEIQRFHKTSWSPAFSSSGTFCVVFHSFRNCSSEKVWCFRNYSSEKVWCLRDYSSEKVWCFRNYSSEKVWCLRDYSSEKVWCFRNYSSEKVWCFRNYSSEKVWCSCTYSSEKVWCSLINVTHDLLLSFTERIYKPPLNADLFRQSMC